MRRYTFANAAAALNVFELATDDVTGLSVQQLNKDNAIIDFVSAPETRQSVITFPSGARTTYPLSQAAIDYYRNIGVDIS